MLPRLGVHARRPQLPPASADRDLSPWNATLAYTNHLLDTAFGDGNAGCESRAPTD